MVFKRLAYLYILMPTFLKLRKIFELSKSRSLYSELACTMGTSNNCMLYNVLSQSIHEMLILIASFFSEIRTAPEFTEVFSDVVSTSIILPIKILL